jgi:hypothetical protein
MRKLYAWLILFCAVLAIPLGAQPTLPGDPTLGVPLSGIEVAAAASLAASLYYIRQKRGQ